MTPALGPIQVELARLIQLASLLPPEDRREVVDMLSSLTAAMASELFDPDEERP